MAAKASVTLEQNRLCVSGDITLRNAMTLYRDSLPRLMQCTAGFTVDFSGLHASDSGGVALMVAWLRLAKTQGQKINFIAVPSSLRAMLKAAGMDVLFD